MAISEELYVKSKVKSGLKFQLGPNVSIGKNVIVGAGTRIRESVILANSVIGSNSLIMHAVIGKKLKCVIKWVNAPQPSTPIIYSY